MKILFVSLFLPMKKSYHAGGRHVYEIIRKLSATHEISLVTRVDQSELPLLDSLRPICREIFPYTYRTKEKRGLLDNLKLVCNYIGFSRFADRTALKGDYAMIQVEWVEAALLIKRRRIPMVLDAHDVITKPAERAMKRSRGRGSLSARLKYALVSFAERRIMRRFDRIFTLSEFDRNYLLGISPDLKVKTVPVPAGLDITDRTFVRKRNTILFLASYKYRKTNVDAALFFYDSVFPLVKKRVPEAKFIIAGYGPPEELTSLQEKDGSVSVPGFVDSLDECYKRATVFVAPILVGGGIIVKILDSMAAGTPVVTTSYGNEGVGAVPGRDLLVADEPEAFAGEVIKVLEDPDLAGRIGASGRDFVRRNYSVETVIGRIESCYSEVTKKREK
jgi:glycosyltransferase involved in cell wall biosynthesis